jgi:hypothetical protein
MRGDVHGQPVDTGRQRRRDETHGYVLGLGQIQAVVTAPRVECPLYITSTLFRIQLSDCLRIQVTGRLTFFFPTCSGRVRASLLAAVHVSRRTHLRVGQRHGR